MSRSCLAEREGRRTVGSAMVVVGSFLLLANLVFINVMAFMPILFLLLGASMVWKAVMGAGAVRPDVADRLKEAIQSSVGVPTGSAAEGVSPTLSAFAVMGGARRATNAQDFKRGDAFPVMGGS